MNHERAVRDRHVTVSYRRGDRREARIAIELIRPAIVTNDAARLEVRVEDHLEAQAAAPGCRAGQQAGRRGTDQRITLEIGYADQIHVADRGWPDIELVAGNWAARISQAGDGGWVVDRDNNVLRAIVVVVSVAGDR